MTPEEAAEYLAQLGLSVPPAMLAAILAVINSQVLPCLDENYDEATKKLILYYLIGLLAITSGGRRVTSQTAPSGAAQSYSYGTLIEQQRQLTNALRLLDTAGCTDGLIPAEPGSKAFLYVAKGGCYGGGCK